jgi:hypothetical protein
MGRVMTLLPTDPQNREGITMTRYAVIAAMMGCTIALTACEDDAAVASRNLSTAADMFEIDRRIVFYNGITGEYMLVIEGRCSIEDQGSQLEVTCKVGPSDFRKHFLGLSDNVTYFAEQVEGADVSVYHHRIIFKPQSILPDVDFVGDAGALVTDSN